MVHSTALNSSDYLHSYRPDKLRQLSQLRWCLLAWPMQKWC